MPSWSDDSLTEPGVFNCLSALLLCFTSLGSYELRLGVISRSHYSPPVWQSNRESVLAHYSSELSSSLSWVLSIKSFYGAYHWSLQLAAVLEFNAFYGFIASLMDSYSTVLLKALTGEKEKQVALLFFSLSSL